MRRTGRIDSAADNRRGGIIVILLCLGIFVPNYAQYQMTALGSRFMESANINPSQLSSILTASMVPGMFFSLISGLLVDRYGAKRILTISFLLTAVGAGIRIWADGFIPMYIGMALLGFHSTFLNTNGSKVFGYWFEPKKVSTLMGIFIAVLNGAMALGMGTGALFPSLKSAFVLSASLIFVVLILWVIFAKDKKNDDSGNIDAPPIKECLKVSLSSRNVWMTGLTLMLLCTGATAMNMFLPTALITNRGFPEASAGAVGMASMIGSAVSCFITPLIDVKLKNTKLLMTIYGILGAVGAAFAWRMPEGIPLLTVLFLTGFLTTGLCPLIMSIPIQLKEIGPKYAGTAGGVIATIQLIGVVVIPTFIITPISGTNYTLLFYLCGIVIALFGVSTQFLPNIRKQNSLHK